MASNAPPIPSWQGSRDAKGGLSTQLYSWLQNLGSFANSQAKSLAATQAQQEVIDFTIESPDNQDYLFEINAPYGYTITQVDSDCRSGSCTATTKIGGTALGGGANSVSTTLQSKTHSSDNVIAAAGTSVVTISSNSSCAGLRLVFWITRT